MLVGFDKYTHRMRFVPVGYIYKVGAGALTRGIDLGGAITPNYSHQRTEFMSKMNVGSDAHKLQGNIFSLYDRHFISPGGICDFS